MPDARLARTRAKYQCPLCGLSELDPTVQHRVQDPGASVVVCRSAIDELPFRAYRLEDQTS